MTDKSTSWITNLEILRSWVEYDAHEEVKTLLGDNWRDIQDGKPLDGAFVSNVADKLRRRGYSKLARQIEVGTECWLTEAP
jgi:hypothetical protein